MPKLHIFGVDVSKDHLDVIRHGAAAKPQRFANSSEGFAAFIARHRGVAAHSLIVCEATGGHEWGFLDALAQAGFAAHRVQPLKAKHFMRSLGWGKTDRLDAAALARYGHERQDRLARFTPPDPSQRKLQALLQRRDDLIAMRTAEQARAKSPPGRLVAESIEAVVNALQDQIAGIEQAIARLIDKQAELRRKHQILSAIPGIGQHTAAVLIGLMPELGQIDRRQAASLAGLAPHPRDSGTTSRYRSTGRGRTRVKRALFMAAMTARRYHPDLKAFYERLRHNGKTKMVPLTAVMRKLITIANAKIRDQLGHIETG